MYGLDRPESKEEGPSFIIRLLRGCWVRTSRWKEFNKWNYSSARVLRPEAVDTEALLLQQVLHSAPCRSLSHACCSLVTPVSQGYPAPLRTRSSSGHWALSQELSDLQAGHHQAKAAPFSAQHTHLSSLYGVLKPTPGNTREGTLKTPEKSIPGCCLQHARVAI